MKSEFKGWVNVSTCLNDYADAPSDIKEGFKLNSGQCCSLRAIAERINNNGVVIADEVGMGKTRIAVAVARSVIESGGRVVILVPPGLGYQWHDELRLGGVDAPLILRSLWQYLEAWKSNNVKDQQPWFAKQVVVISHAFTNWRLGENSDSWRWALLPDFYARWRQRTMERLPRYYINNDKLSDEWVKNAAKSICDAIPTDVNHPAFKIATELSEHTPWPGALDAGEYRRNSDLRPWLESVVGLGLGIFDLVIIDEAHKSRGDESGLSRLLEKVVLSSPGVRRFGMTATPVELDVSQWKQTLGRIGVTDFDKINEAISQYSEAVKRVRRLPNNSDARDNYKICSLGFQQALTPYLLRRDKREDPAVQKYKEYTGSQNNDYRDEKEIPVETKSLKLSWKQAICAAESLSVVTSLAENSIAKRLRLTLGSGHGVSLLLDQTKHNEEEDRHQDASDEQTSGLNEIKADLSDSKREERIRWWINVMKTPFLDGDDVLFNHPAILAAVKAIEEITAKDGKVLVFGRFTRPLRALVDLLNARKMLRLLQNNRPWPQAKVHGDPSGDIDSSEWPALRAAHAQLKSDIRLDQIDTILDEQYKEMVNQRRALRRHLVDKLEQGFLSIKDDERSINLFKAFKESIADNSEDESEIHPLTLVCKAIYELHGYQDGSINPEDLSITFVQLLNALSDRGEGDQDGDGKISEQEAIGLWATLFERLKEEFNRPQGGFARLMYGGTRTESRRMIQLAFNRPNSFPKVLVAQSIVGREGLNLHHACRNVVLLHPEWNPGVVEQQIGRVDRLGSEWEKQLDKAIKDGCTADNLPRIEVMPVIFKGTYDEYNWEVLRDRWDDLRAQLHGIVIPSRLANNDKSLVPLIEEIAKSSPNFSPNRIV